MDDRTRTPGTFVIVHGAGSGGWLWQRVRRRLQAEGHEVYTPTLTGVGERAHLAGPDVSLSTHIQDVLGLLRYEDLESVVLVGHSYGGMVIAGVANEAPEGLARLIYVDAFMPSDGESVLTLVPPPVRAMWEEQARTQGDGWKLPPLPHAALGRIAEDGLPEEEIRRLLTRRVPQPLQTYAEPVRLTNPAALALPCSYVYCSDKPPDDPFAHYARRVAEGGQCRVCDLNTGHFAMLSTPGELCALLIQIAQGHVALDTEV